MRGKIQEKGCPVCGSLKTEQFLERKNVPVHQNLLFPNPISAKHMERGDLTLFLCLECGFISNKAFDQRLIQYGHSYNNSQEFSPAFKKYTDQLAESILALPELSNGTIVEVGCGKGQFLRKLMKGNKNLRGIGFDPSYEGETTDDEGRLTFIKDYYGTNYSHIHADVVVCRHVIEHVPDPIDLLKTIRGTLSLSPQARVFFETPCVHWILENHVFWDFFYEHCSYFTANSLRTAFQVSDFYVEKVCHIFGGQYLWLEAKIGDRDPIINKNADAIPSLAGQFSSYAKNKMDRWAYQLKELQKKGKIAVAGAGAKGSTFVNTLDPHGLIIDCVADINPDKQNKYLPGTGHPIISYQELGQRQVEFIIVLNPNYTEEVKEILHGQGLKMAMIQMD